MLAAAAATGVACTFAAPIGGKGSDSVTVFRSYHKSKILNIVSPSFVNIFTW